MSQISSLDGRCCQTDLTSLVFSFGVDISASELDQGLEFAKVEHSLDITREQPYISEIVLEVLGVERRE